LDLYFLLCVINSCLRASIHFDSSFIPIQRVPGVLSVGVKRPEREADHSPPSSAEVKECMELYFQSPNTPSWRGAQLKEQQRDNFTFTLHRVGFIFGRSESKLFSAPTPLPPSRSAVSCDNEWTRDRRRPVPLRYGAVAYFPCKVFCTINYKVVPTFAQVTWNLSVEDISGFS
jgi:hypothetical protein